MARADVQALLKGLDEINDGSPSNNLTEVAAQLTKLVKASEAQVRLSRVESKKEAVCNHDVLTKVAKEINVIASFDAQPVADALSKVVKDINVAPIIDMQPLADALKEVINKDKQVYKFSVERNRDGLIQTITAQPE